MQDDTESMRRITLILTFDQGLLEIEGKSESSGRLFSAEMNRTVAAKLINGLASRLAAGVKDKTSVSLKVDRTSHTILPDQ